MMEAKAALENLARVDRSSIHPMLAQQKQIDELFSPKNPDMLSDLTMDEIRTIALYRALDKMLDGELGGVSTLFDNYIKLKLSYDRLSRKELSAILRPGAKYYISGSSTHDPENQEQMEPPKKKKRFILF